MTFTIEDVVAHANSIADGSHDTVRPGMDMAFSEASTDGDMIWQGDLGIGITSGGVPEGYVKVDKITNLCLVPGQDQTIGSKHCLESAAGVEMWVPTTPSAGFRKDEEVWNEESLDGPYLRISNGIKITHPVHGDVSVPSCFKEVQIVYQREWDAEQARERRAAD
jgi:hypothetical protein